jgi:VCBS repeat-containing protein
MASAAIYVGRIGALAVALGVGMAVTSTQSLASAGPASSADTTTKPHKVHSRQNPTAVASTAAVAKPDSTAEGEPASTAVTENTHQRQVTTHKFRSPVRTKKTPAPQTLAATRPDPKPPAAQTVTAIPKTVEAVRSSPAASIDPSPSIVSSVAPTAPAPEGLRALPPTVALTPSSGFAAFSALPNAIVKTIASVANIVLGSLAAPRPGVPQDPSVLWAAVVAVVRREFFNQRPKIESVVSAPDAAGNITVSLNQTDADGDKLNYAATTSGDKGTVSLNPDGHSFTYTPKPGATGTDTVTVTATETSADTIHGLAGLIHALSFGLLGDAGRTATATVTVHLNTPPTPSTVTDPETDSNGIVTGTVTFTDRDGDTVTYSVPAKTTKGSVEIDSGGTYKYTPDAGQRYIADGITGPYTDTFTVTASDGHGGTSSQDVTVTIKPASITADPQAAADALQNTIVADTVALQDAQAAFGDTLANYLAGQSQGTSSLTAQSSLSPEQQAQAELLATAANAAHDDTIAKQLLADVPAGTSTLPADFVDSAEFQTLKKQQVTIAASQADLQVATRTWVVAKSQVDAPQDGQTPYYQRVEYTVNPDKSITGRVYFVDPNGAPMVIGDSGVGNTQYFGPNGNADGTFTIPAPAAGDKSSTVTITFGAHNIHEYFSGNVTLTLDRSTSTVIPGDTPKSKVLTTTAQMYSDLGSSVGSIMSGVMTVQAAQLEAEARGDEADAKFYEAQVQALDSNIDIALAQLSSVKDQFLAVLGT